MKVVGREFRVERQESESERMRMEEKEQEEEWVTIQERARSMATSSARKLVQCAPAEQDRESDAPQTPHAITAPEPPGPKVVITEPSVQTEMSQEGREAR
jgi:ATPase subunit of ABC transporter with duplicated ATPase domains